MIRVLELVESVEFEHFGVKHLLISKHPECDQESNQRHAGINPIVLVCKKLGMLLW